MMKINKWKYSPGNWKDISVEDLSSKEAQVYKTPNREN